MRSTTPAILGVSRGSFTAGGPLRRGCRTCDLGCTRQGFCSFVGNAEFARLGAPHRSLIDEDTMALIQYLTQVQFEFGASRLLSSECARVGINRPLIVTDAGVRAAGVLQKALDALADLEVAVFDQTPSNPTEAAV